MNGTRKNRNSLEGGLATDGEDSGRNETKWSNPRPERKRLFGERNKEVGEKESGEVEVRKVKKW